MSTYVMTDIHGCYDEMMAMLDKINFTPDDQLIVAGDYIDRGKQNMEMLEWTCSHPNNILTLMGNHDSEFVQYVDLMRVVVKSNNLVFNRGSNESMQKLYRITKAVLSQCDDCNSTEVFDYYGTMGDLILNHNVCFSDFEKWVNEFVKFPLQYKTTINGRKYVVAHAGYIEVLTGTEIELKYDSTDEFMLYARDDACKYGGLPGGTVVAGHTPTILEDEFAYTGGTVFKYYNEKTDCTFFDIDCGCAYKELCSKATLACIRLEDEKIWYL